MTAINADPEPLDFQVERSVLIVVDMQNAYASKGGYLDLAGFDVSGATAVIDNVLAAIEVARANSMRIIYFKNGWDGSYLRAGGPLSPNQRKSNALKFMRATRSILVSCWRKAAGTTSLSTSSSRLNRKSSSRNLVIAGLSAPTSISSCEAVISRRCFSSASR